MPAVRTSARRGLRKAGVLLLQVLSGLLVVLVSAVAAHAVSNVVRQSGADEPAVSVTISNSKEGTPILSAGNLKPGGQSTGTVQIGNTGNVPVTLQLEQNALVGTAGQGGAMLASTLQLRIEDLGGAKGVGSGVVYSGPLTGLRALPVGTYDANEAHNYRFTVIWPETGRDDNALQGSSVSLGYRWTATADTSTTDSKPKAPDLRVTSRSLTTSKVHALNNGVSVQADCPDGCTVAARLLMLRSVARRYGIADDPLTETDANSTTAHAASTRQAADESSLPAWTQDYTEVGTATQRLEKAGTVKLTVHLRPDVQAKLAGVRRIPLVLFSQMFGLDGGLQRSLHSPVVFTGVPKEATATPPTSAAPETPTTTEPAPSSASASSENGPTAKPGTSKPSTSGSGSTPPAASSGGVHQARSGNLPGTGGDPLWPWLLGGGLALLALTVGVRWNRRRRAASRP